MIAGVPVITAAKCRCIYIFFFLLFILASALDHLSSVVILLCGRKSINNVYSKHFMSCSIAVKSKEMRLKNIIASPPLQLL